MGRRSPFAMVLAMAAAVPLAGWLGAQGAGVAGAWPQWLGPTQNGAAPATGVFAGASAVQLKKAWSRPLETGLAGLAVAEGRVYTLFRDGSDDHAVALNAETGAEVWRAKLDPGVETPWLSGPPSTPAVHGGLVFTLSSGCRLRGHEAASGRVVWDVDVKQKFGTQYPMGCASSPFVDGGRLYVHTGGREDHRLAAFDPRTGGVLWTAKGSHRALNSSPAAADVAGVRHILASHTSGGGGLGITGFRQTDGSVLWSAELVPAFSFDTPQALPGDRVFLQTANDLHVLQVRRQDEAWSTAPAWRTTDLQAYVSPPVFHQGHLYGMGGDFLACVEAENGRTAWKEKIYPGSVILVDGHLIILSTSAGLLRVVEASAAGYREKARLEVFNRGAQALAPPSFAGRRIFVRSEEGIAAVDVR